MATKPPVGNTEPIDIFSSPRLEQAMQRSVASVVIPPEPPLSAQAPPEPAVADNSASTAAPAPRPRPRDPQQGRTRAARGAPPSTVTSTPLPEPDAPAVLERNVPLKFQVPYGLRAEFQTFKAELSATLGVLLDDSNIARPYFELLLSEFRDRIVEIARTHRGHLRRPAHGDSVGMAEFDEAIGNIVREAIRRRPARSVSSEPER